jgi:signal transduction histidine kinase
MEHDSQIVIGPDGTVLAAAGQLPLGLVDARLETCQGLPHEVREAGKILLHELRTSGNRVATRTVAPGGAGEPVQLVAIDALVIRRAPTDLRELLKSKLSVIASQAASAEVKLSVNVADDVPSAVQLDSEKIAWAVTALVGNALRYVRSGSRHQAGGTIAVAVRYERAASEVTIEVQDDGPGIPKDTVTRLFRRDGLNVRGAGLSLVLISDIMAAHGGRIDLRSSTDPFEQGTTVRLVFPVG